MRVSERLKRFLTMLFFMTMGMSGLSGAFLTVLTPSCHRLLTAVAIFAFCILFTLIYQQKKGRRKVFSLAVIFILYIVCWVWKMPELREGITSLAESVIQLANKYYKVNLIIVEGVAGGIGETTFTILVILFGIAGVLGYGIVGRFSKSITGILFSLPLVSGFLLGKVPDFPWILCMILCYAGIVAGSGRNQEPVQWLQEKTALVMAVAAGAAVLLAVFLVHPIIERQYPRLQKANVQLREYVNREIWPELTRFDEWFSWSGTKQTVSGDLEHADGFFYTGARALTVTVQEKPQNTVYLKGFTAGHYTGKAWEANPQDDLRQYAQAYGWDSADNVDKDVWNLEFAAAQVITGYNGKASPQDIQIKRISAPDQYTYYPYGAYLNEPLPVLGDGALQGVDAAGWSFAFLPWESFYPSDYPGNPLEAASWSVLEQQYEQYVYSSYLEYPKEQLLRLAKQCEESGLAGADVKTISDYIVKTLGQTASYNLNAEKCPEGREFTENFLYDTREGYCVHFATAATLMFRMLGIPARYATGYVAPADTFKADSSGTYTATVEDQKAHAWAEIYISRLGWVPVEATPGYAVSASPDSSQQNEDAGSVRQEQTPKEDVQQTETPTPGPSEGSEENFDSSSTETVPEDEGSANAGEVMQIIGKVLLCLIGAAAAFLLGRSLLVWRRIRDFTVGNSKENICNIFRYLHRALLFAGFPGEIDVTSEVFTDKLCSRYTELRPDEAEAFMDLVMRASYSSEKFDKRDSQEAQKFYIKTCAAVCGKLPFYKRFIFQMIFC